MDIFAIVALGLAVATSPTYGYLSAGIKDHYLSDLFLRDFVDRMNRDLGDPSYIDPLGLGDPAGLDLMARTSKDLEGEQMDYESLLDGDPNPSLRDQEYLQHSALWGHQFVSGGAGEGPHREKPQVKTDASLPAYCNPPNPCPVGYTEDQGCMADFENTAAFSREYQASQDCMCDSEHMFKCVAPDNQGDTEFKRYLARQFPKGVDHKNLVAKKYFQKKRVSEAVQNPFLAGEKLPIAAKKGFRLSLH